MELHFRRADTADIERIMDIIHQAQTRMGLRGTTQWQDGYPSRQIIDNDIVEGWGYVAVSKDVVIAYTAVGDYEVAYDHLQGDWLTDGKYLVVHRLAVADEALRKGVATAIMKFVQELAVEQGVPSIKIDTNFDNDGMLAILERLGSKYCGKVYYESGERVAYEFRVGA